MSPVSYRWSVFRVRVPLAGGLIIMKSTLTSALITIDNETEHQIESWLAGEGPEPAGVPDLLSEDIGLLVRTDHDEFAAWQARLVERRNDHAHMFIMHFMPTIQCQLRCNYCIQKGTDRGKAMQPGMIATARAWLDRYFEQHPEIDTFRFVLFGGEPLLKKEAVRAGLEAFHSLARERGIEFWTEITTNGELLDEPTAELLARHNWRRVQITLDGPQEIHDARRHGTNERPTFASIMANIEMLVSTDHIPAVDIRMSLDMEMGDRVPELVRFLAGFGRQDRMNLSVGMITPTFADPKKEEREAELAAKALAVWQTARECGFKVPEEYVTGPWCVAIAKHSAILEPDGSLQKCFCTAGRKEYNFSTVFQKTEEGKYLRDPRFERFRRTDECVREKCPFLPMCGGGCIHNAVVEHGAADGFERRFCQKTLLAELNRGLIEMSAPAPELACEN